MEKDLKIALGRGIFLYGRLSGSLRLPLMITVHGLPGDIYVGLHERACEWFAEKGYATFRFNLYGWQKDARQLMDCTLKTHATDLDTVITFFRKKGVKKIFVTGHSYGGPVILLSRRQEMDAAVLWDPSFGISFTKTAFGVSPGKYIKSVKGYLMRWGANTVIGERMAQEADDLVWAGLTKNFLIPLKIIAAGKGMLISGAKRYIHHAHDPKELTIIKNATHHFDDTPKMREDLFKLSKQWFDRF